MNSTPAPAAPARTAAAAHAPVAVLCDLDGTLLDTERTWLATVRTVIAELGVRPSEALVAKLEGATVEQASTTILAALAAAAVLPALPGAGAIAERLEAASLEAPDGTIRWCPGAEELLGELRAAGIPLALVTSSSRRWLEAAARQVDLSAFAHFVTADDVAATKPHPEPYLLAAALLGREPGTCVVFEDSEVGLRAALAAGCTAVLVRDTGASWADHADAVLHDLRGTDAAWVRALAGH